MAIVSSPKRRFRFSLKALLLVYLPITAVFAFLASYANFYREQHAIASHFRKFGPMARVEMEQGPFGAVTSLVLFCPAAASDYRLIGRLSELKTLQLHHNGFTFGDSDLRSIANLKNLNDLCLNEVNITDDGMQYLQSQEKITSLTFGPTRVTDAGWLHLAHLKHLETLMLVGEITDDGLRALQDLRELRSLTVLAPITGRGFRFLNCNETLTHVDVSRCEIDDAGFREICRFRNLEILYLESARVTKVGLESVASLPKLKWLDLSKTRIDDDALLLLVNVSSLELLGLMDTQITNEGLEHLSACPKLVLVNFRGTEATLERAAIRLGATPSRPAWANRQVSQATSLGAEI